MKLSLKERLLKYLRGQYPKKIASGELERLAIGVGKTGSNCTRRLRELAEEGLLQVEYREKNHAYYSATPPLMVEAYRVPITGEVINKPIW